MGRFTGRIAFVTGAGYGIGRAIAHRLGTEGASVAVADVEPAAMDQVAAELAEMGVPAATFFCDVTDRFSVEAAMEGASQRFGGVDVLVNTAGGQISGGTPGEMDDDTWARQLDLTLTGTMRCVRAALPALRASESAAVVVIGSINGLTAIGGEHYSAAKAGLVNLTSNLAARYGADGVRVNLVAPGTVRTRAWEGREADLERITALYPLGRVGEPADIAAAAAFLASDDAAWITGVTLPVDGGALTGPAQLLQANR